MKAPDKVYVAAQWHPNEKVSSLHVSYEKTTHPYEEEFVRKDALIEWANNMIKDDKNRGKKDGYYDLIEKLNSL